MSAFKSINWSILIPVIIAFFGWYVVNQQNIERDRQNKLRDIKTQYLIDAYRNLSDASMRAPEPKSIYYHKIESAISDIQLFGTLEQIAQANRMAQEYSTTSQISLDPILNDLRSQLRSELGLPQLHENVRWLRMEGAPNVPKSQPLK